MLASEKLQLLEEKVCVCNKCEALVANRTQTVFGIGNPEAEIVFCGEGPGRSEDKEGEPFVGRAGELLNNIISSCELKREDVFILNIVKCRPPNNRAPTEEEANNCKPFLDLQLKVINPRYIICLGGVASNNVLGFAESQPMYELRGKWFEYKNKPVDAKVLCTYHPAYLLRNPKAKKDVWGDMQMLLEERR
jgi:DNA polymerase